MIDLKNEIRINNKYAHLYSAEYKGDNEKGESVPKINQKALLTPDYLRRLALGFGAPSASVLPPNCRFIENFQQGSIVVIEEPPAFRTVRIHMNFNPEIKKLKSEGKLEEYGYSDEEITTTDPYSSKTFTLALPYVIFIMHISDHNELICGQVFFRVARLTGMADYLLKAPFTNISEKQYICYGNSAFGQVKTLNNAVEKAINSFWTAEFNTDYTYNYRAYKEIAGISSYMEWQALSRIDPMFIYNVDWIKIPMSISEGVSEIKRHYKLTNKHDIQYRQISDIFSSPLDSGKDEKPTPRSKTQYRLY